MIAKDYKYALRLPKEDEPEVAELVKQTGQSINSVLVQCIRKGLPLVRQAFCKNGGRVTTVDPLPDYVLEQIYARSDEMSEVTAAELTGFQSQTEPK